MDDLGLRDDEKVVGEGSLRAWHLLVIGLVAVGMIVGAYLKCVRDAPETAPPQPGTGVVVVPEGSRTITLFFASDDDPVLITESRQVAIGRVFSEQVAQLIRALLVGPEKSGASTIPTDTRLLQAYFDDETFTVYLDFSGELVAGHPGGSSAEYATILAIMKTVSENFPEVQRVQILVDGLQIESIAGHVDVEEPLWTKDWR